MSSRSALVAVKPAHPPHAIIAPITIVRHSAEPIQACVPQNDFIKFYVSTKCRGNTYPTTLLYLCLGINKLSILTKVQNVYRAPGGRLPSSFYEACNDGALGGVELGFMSTTTEKEEALKYAAYSGMPMVFEVQQGMVARGAEISWLSQFPSEAEGESNSSTLANDFHAQTETCSHG